MTNNQDATDATKTASSCAYPFNSLFSQQRSKEKSFLDVCNTTSCSIRLTRLKNTERAPSSIDILKCIGSKEHPFGWVPGLKQPRELFLDHSLQNLTQEAKQATDAIANDD